MDWKEFAASMLASLTWPAAVSALAFLFRREIKERNGAIREESL